MLDTAYDAYENYRMIRNSGRRPVNDPRKDHTLKGYNPRAEMLRWRRKNPEKFERTYHRRSLADSTSSPIKSKFGAVVAAKTLPPQRLQLILRSVCYSDTQKFVQNIDQHLLESITNSQKNSVFHEGFDSIIRFLNASTFYGLLTPCTNFGVWLYNLLS